MRRARDPVLFFSIYLDKHRPGSSADPRQAVLEQVDRFVEKYKLQADGPPLPHQHAAGINLGNLQETSSAYQLLFRAQTEYPRSPSGRFYQCLAYAYSDALIVQFMISRFADWVGGLTAGWNELIGELRAGFDGTVLEAAHDMTFGASAVYWTIVDGDKNPEEYSDEVQVLAEDRRLLRTRTDLGPLWQCDRPLFTGVETVSQDLWMLVTPRSAESEVNKRFHRLRPPDFAVVALAGHKIKFESWQYLEMGEEMGPLYQVLDERASRILEVQAQLGRELDELRSDKAVDFQQTLAAEAHRLADYRNQIGRAKGLRRTLIINRRNYLINCLALISSQGARQVERSRDQEQAAVKFLDTCGEEEIFGTTLGQFQGKWNQLDSDLDYADSVIERYASSLQSATDQLWIAGERELGEIAHHISVDSAAVVASVAAFLIVELVVKPKADKGSQWPPLANVWELALAVVIGSFAVTQVLGSGCRGKRLERYSVTLAAGFLGAWLASLAIGTAGFPCLVYSVIWQSVAFVLGWFVGGTLYSRLSQRLARGRRRDFHEQQADQI